MRKILLPVLLCRTLCHAGPFAAGEEPKDVLAHVKQVYSTLHAVHITASISQEMQKEILKEFSSLAVEAACIRALAGGARTADLGGGLSTRQMGDAVLAQL